MRWKLVLLAAVVIGALAGSWIKNLPGFVIIAVGTTSYEMRLWVAVALLLLLLLSLALVGILARSVFSGMGKVKGWHGGRSWRQARRKTVRGMLAFTEGRWKQAEDAMVEAAKKSDTQLINYLIAAQAAQYQQAEVRRDAYLRLAHKAEPRAKIAIGLTQAQLQLKNEQYEQALATLTELRRQQPNHLYVLKLLTKAFRAVRDWASLLDLLPALNKYKVFVAPELEKINHQCVAGLLKEIAHKGELERLRDGWQKLPVGSRKLAVNQCEYVQYLIQFGEFSEAEKIARNLLKKNSGSEVITLYSQIRSSDPQKQFATLEAWHQSHVHAPREIFLALGNLAYQAKLWGKASLYLEQSLQNNPLPMAYWLLAKTLEQLGEHQQAMNAYQAGLTLAVTPSTGHEVVALEGASQDRVKAELSPQFGKLK